MLAERWIYWGTWFWNPDMGLEKAIAGKIAILWGLF